jgi:hypothetical protein
MLPIQSSELAIRLRSFFRLTGRIPAVLDETTVPVINVGDLDRPPWRRDPRSFIGWGNFDGAGAGLVNWVVFQHQLGHPGCSHITRARAIVREASSASGAAVYLMVGWSDVAVGGAVQESVANTEPTGFHGGNVDYLPLEQREVGESFAAMQARQCKKVDEQILPVASTPGAVNFCFEPIMLVAGGFIAIGVQDVAGASVAPDAAANVSGEFFSNTPTR